MFVVDREGVLPDGAPAGSLSARVDEETGFLHVRDSKIARSGTLVYSDGQRQWNEYRSRATIADSADSFSGVIFTNRHPPALITTDNVKQHQAGHLGNVRADGQWLIAEEIVITDATAIARAHEPGGWELSIGFLTRVIQRDGLSPEGSPFQFEQTDLEGNHVAGEDVGRAGPEVRLAMDSAASVTALHDTEEQQPKPAPAEDKPTMSKETDAELKAKADAAEKAKADAAEALKIKADADAKAAADAKAKADADSKPAPVDPTAQINRRVSILRSADVVLDAVDESASDEVLQLAIIVKVDGDDAISGHEGWSADYRNATFDAAVRSHKREATRATTDTAQQIAAMTGGRSIGSDSDATPLEKVFLKYETDLRGGHVAPAAASEAKGL